MIRWNLYWSSSLLVSTIWLLTFPSRNLADERKPFDCHVTASGAEFDLTKLGGKHSLNLTSDTPPTTSIDHLEFNLCADLEHNKDIEDQDQCTQGTRACLTIVNQKKGVPDRVISVIRLAQPDSSFTATAILSDPKSLNILFKGQDYPHPVSSAPTPQMLNVTIQCNPTPSEPKYLSYDGSVANLEWSAPSGCPAKLGSEPPKDDKGGSGDHSKPEERVGSGMGWFLLVILLALAAYFGVGAYYNYSMYGARGIDLIPHRDFWQEVPYMLKDVVSHLCSSVHPRRPSRGGYVAV